MLIDTGSVTNAHIKSYKDLVHLAVVHPRSQTKRQSPLIICYLSSKPATNFAVAQVWWCINLG